MKQLSYPCSCHVCYKLTSSLGIDTHFMRKHGTPKQKALFDRASDVNKQKAENKRTEYYSNPNKCRACNAVLEYNVRFNNTC